MHSQDVINEFEHESVRSWLEAKWPLAPASAIRSAGHRKLHLLKNANRSWSKGSMALVLSLLQLKSTKGLSCSEFWSSLFTLYTVYRRSSPTLETSARLLHIV